MYFCRRGLAGNIINSRSHGFNSISSTSFSTALSSRDSDFSTLQTHIVPDSIASPESQVGPNHAACFCTHDAPPPLPRRRASRPRCSAPAYGPTGFASLSLPAAFPVSLSSRAFCSLCCIRITHFGTPTLLQALCQVLPTQSVIREVSTCLSCEEPVAPREGPSGQWSDLLCLRLLPVFGRFYHVQGASAAVPRALPLRPLTRPSQKSGGMISPGGGFAGRLEFVWALGARLPAKSLNLGSYPFCTFHRAELDPERLMT